MAQVWSSSKHRLVGHACGGTKWILNGTVLEDWYNTRTDRAFVYNQQRLLARPDFCDSRVHRYRYGESGNWREQEATSKMKRSIQGTGSERGSVDSGPRLDRYTPPVGRLEVRKIDVCVGTKPIRESSANGSTLRDGELFLPPFKHTAPYTSHANASLVQK